MKQLEKARKYEELYKELFDRNSKVTTICLLLCGAFSNCFIHSPYPFFIKYTTLPFFEQVFSLGEYRKIRGSKKSPPIYAHSSSLVVLNF